MMPTADAKPAARRSKSPLPPMDGSNAGADDVSEDELSPEAAAEIERQRDA